MEGTIRLSEKQKRIIGNLLLPRMRAYKKLSRSCDCESALDYLASKEAEQRLKELSEIVVQLELWDVVNSFLEEEDFDGC